MSKVKEQREAKGFRKEDLASKAGISLAYVYKLESANPPTPGLDVARAIARALGTSVDRLFPADARQKASA